MGLMSCSAMVVHVLGHVALGEDAGLHLGMHGLDPPVEHLGEAGDVFDQRDGDAGFAERAGGAARRDDLDAEVGEAAGERLKTALVEHRDEGTLDLHGGLLCRRGSPRVYRVGLRRSRGSYRGSRGCLRARVGVAARRAVVSSTRGVRPRANVRTSRAPGRTRGARRRPVGRPRRATVGGRGTGRRRSPWRCASTPCRAPGG